VAFLADGFWGGWSTLDRSWLLVKVQLIEKIGVYYLAGGSIALGGALGCLGGSF